MLPAKLVFIVVVALAAGMALAGAPALATQPSCGDTITADTTLDADLVNCPNHGIVIGADDISLDLNGHRIDGDGTRFADCRPRTEFCDLGVVNDGHDGVTVRNGSVREFDTGVLAARARLNRVLGISSSRNRFFGFVFAESARSVVRDSSGNDNPAPDGDGIGVFASRRLRILDSSFRRNALGMHVDDSTNLLIKGNLFADTSGPGILMEADRNQVLSNRCRRNDACIVVAPGNRNVIARNRLFRDGEGIAIEKGRGNLVARNVVRGPRRAGIRLGIPRPPIGGVNTVVRLNVVRGSGADGFLVAKSDRHSLLIGNIASGAGDDGFDVRSPSTRLSANRGTGNADLGIAAVLGVVAYGNFAGRNGDPRQCTNVFCR